MQLLLSACVGMCLCVCVYVFLNIYYTYINTQHNQTLEWINTHNTDILQISWIFFQYHQEEILNPMDSVAIFTQRLKLNAGRSTKQHVLKRITAWGHSCYPPIDCIMLFITRYYFMKSLELVMLQSSLSKHLLSNFLCSCIIQN